MSPKRSLVVLLALLMVAGMACGSGDGDGGSGATGTAAEGEPDPEGTLRLAQTIVPTQWDPHNGRSAVVDYSIMGPVYDRLLVLQPDMTPGPMLAESYELADDNRSITFALRDDVTFHDGTHFDAEVVKANVEHTQALDSVYAARLAIVDEVVVVDDYTVRFDLNADGQMFPLTVAQYIGVGGMVSPEALADPDGLATTPAGSGPYELVEQTQDRAVYEKVDDYWDEELLARAPRRIELVSISQDSARLAALESGQVDAMTVNDPIADIDSVTAGGDIELYEITDTNRNIQVSFNTNEPALADPLVRRALSLATDRAAITSSVLHDSCRPTVQPFGEGTLGHNPDVEVTPYDLEEARELLDEAGVDELSLRVSHPTGTMFNNVAVAIQSQWAELDVSVEVFPVEAAVSQSEFRAGEYDAYLNRSSGFPDPQPLIQDYFVETNLPGPTDPELAELQEAAAAEPLGSDERDAAYQGMAEYLGENPFNVVVCTSLPQLLYHTNVGGIEDGALTRLQSAWDTRNLVVLS